MATFSVVLVEPRYQGNIGSVARVMKNFGFRNLVMINPPEVESEARAYAAHAQELLKGAVILKDFSQLKIRFDFLVATTAQVASDKNSLRTPVLPDDLKNAAALDGDVALIFGREDYGLYNEEIAACDLLVSIPADSQYPTLNLSQSVAILLYELSKPENSKRLRSMRKCRKANKIEKDVLLKNIDELVDKTYGQEFEGRLAKKTFRQIIGRAFISGREAFTLVGLFKRIGRPQK
ncbi:MAG: hypothetical protein MSIBF_01525 [Candidatus Altiarchaeales archaeon IMC4]|nr:MAG: hypothetical protein MSIBF_01525 [Candidatus Altiarchaeales archaeon IMC4]